LKNYPECEPAVSEKRLSLTPSGNIRYQLKTPYSDGTTHIIFEPLDFMSHILVLYPSGDLCRANWLSWQIVIAKDLSMKLSLMVKHIGLLYAHC
jgi:hypothetical protein